jgi:hypothetical protein
MGAWLDSRTGYGKTAGEAFRQAHDQAAWEEGHGGYTGSIAEKHDASIFACPTSPKGTKMKASKFKALIIDAMELSSEEELDREEADAKRFYKGAARQQQLKWIRASRRERKKFERQAGFALDAVLRAAEVANDKWGPAVGIELHGVEYRNAKERLNLKGKQGIRIFTFFGMCSS